MRSLGSTCSIFCFPPSGRTHSNCVSAPHSAHLPMAHPSPYGSMGFAEADLDGFGRLRFLAFINRWQSIARPREAQMVIKGRGPPGQGGLGGERGRFGRKSLRRTINSQKGAYGGHLASSVVLHGGGVGLAAAFTRYRGESAILSRGPSTRPDPAISGFPQTVPLRRTQKVDARRRRWGSRCGRRAS